MSKTITEVLVDFYNEARQDELNGGLKSDGQLITRAGTKALRKIEQIIAEQASEDDVHMAMLAKSANAKDCGELTVVPLGFAVSTAEHLLSEQREKLKEIL